MARVRPSEMVIDVLVGETNPGRMRGCDCIAGGSGRLSADLEFHRSDRHLIEV
jgi:hypothetical protein